MSCVNHNTGLVGLLVGVGQALGKPPSIISARGSKLVRQVVKSALNCPGEEFAKGNRKEGQLDASDMGPLAKLQNTT